MKKQIRNATAILFCLFLPAIINFSCNKQKEVPVCCVVGSFSHPILFEIVDKNGNSVVHSTSDLLTVTYNSAGGLLVTQVLDVIRVQKSTTDTTRVSLYNGFVISDADPSRTGAGYLSTNSFSGGITNFKFYLNNQLLGPVYFNFTPAENAISQPNNNSFTLNGNLSSTGSITGVLAPGFPTSLGFASGEVFSYTQTVNYFTTPANMTVYVVNTGQ